MLQAVAKYSYDPQREDELRLCKGDVVTVLEKSSDGWWKGKVIIFYFRLQRGILCYRTK